MRPLSARAVAHLERWDGVVAPARDAASVLLTRPGPGGLEVLLQRRPPTMAFAAGMHVFPGGAVQPGDREPAPWSTGDASTWARRWACSEQLAAALVVAAVRETFEETGILLAGADHEELADVADDDTWGADRSALESGRRSLAAVLRDRGLLLRVDLLGPWAHWITPTFEPRRFDTRFFVATLPATHGAVLASAEAERSFWTTPGAAVRAAAAGELPLMMPTLHNLRRLAGAVPETVLAHAAGRPIRTVEPRLVEVDGRMGLTAVDDPLDPVAAG